MTIDLRAERVNRGLSLDDAAEGMNVDKSVLWRAEEGQAEGKQPRAGNAFKIATYYGYKVTDVWPLPEPAEGAAA